MFGPGTLDNGSRRRSIYFTIKRSQMIPAMQAFDAPEPLVSQGQRQTTTVAPQALMLMNSAQARSWAEGFAARFDAPAVLDGERARVAAEGYLAHCGQRYAARWCSTAFLRLSESIDLHRIDPAAISVPTVVVAVEGDRLVPLADLVGLVEGLGPRGSLRVLRSPYGHDAFLKETDRIDAILATAFRTSGESA